MTKLLRLVLRFGAVVVLLIFVAGALAVAGTWWYLVPKLPSTENLREVRLQVPLKVYTKDEQLIAEFGEQRRTPVKIAEVPDTMIKALLAAEDERFYEHPGVDWQGLTRAVVHLIRTGEKGPGGSTITMQVARNFYLGREKTYLRKLSEILLALKIEDELSKDEILELYLNKIFLGHRAYGVGAAAQVYYGTSLENLTLSEIAMIAGLPKAPSRYNPIADPERAVERRNYVLRRMYELEFIDSELYQIAINTPVTARVHGHALAVEAPYLAEMVRAYMEERAGSDAYSGGYRVYTTLDGDHQEAANQALRKALLDYDVRHGYRGPEFQIDLREAPDATTREKLLADFPRVGGLEPALIINVNEQAATAHTRAHGEIEIPWTGISWARRYIDENRRGGEPETVSDVLSVGDVVRVQQTQDGWRLTQVPAVEGGLVATNPLDGAILALVGGFDFYRSKFNRVTQAQRQPGSSFKPFIYSAAIERGLTAATIINDAPIVIDDPGLEAVWRPENYSRKFFGPTRLREALTKSRNLVSIRVLRDIGVGFAVKYLPRFGFEPDRLPRNLSLSLGSGTVTPLEMAVAYSVFANGGYRIVPYYIDRIVSSDGETIEKAEPQTVCRECEVPSVEGESLDTATAIPRNNSSDSALSVAATSVAPTRAQQVVTPQNAWLINSMLQDVIRRGTGRRALELKRSDLAGKTGTTNDQRDAWFAGFTPGIVAIAWVGFDKLHPLGKRETGGRAALPMWINFMENALAGMPEEFLERPDGLVSVRIDPKTGLLATATQPDAQFETFRAEHVPQQLAERSSTTSQQTRGESSTGGVTEQLF